MDINILPNKKEFLKTQWQGNVIPLTYEVTADTETPVSAYYKLINGEIEPDSSPYNKCSFMLESVEGGENIGRYSFLGVSPKGVFVQKNRTAEYIDCKTGEKKEITGTDVFQKIGTVMRQYKYETSYEMPPFSGGAVGYFAYDVISEVEPTVLQPEKDSIATPEAFFMITDTLLAFDHVYHTIKIISHAFIDEHTSKEAAYEEAAEKISSVIEKLSNPISFSPIELPGETQNISFVSNKTKEEFFEMVEKAKKYITDGDIIQVVVAQRFKTDINVTPLAVHRALRMINPSPYMFILDCKDFALVGASPEVHTRCTDAEIVIRPIAGTRWRGKTKEEDRQLEQELLEDPKERAEHIMLVDLARNDIGRIAIPGSVKVDELMIVEHYSHVMHIVSNVKGILDRDKYDTDAVMRSTFPAGTLTGAPKIRAMQIISELEKEKRGIYGGAVAYYSFNGNLDSCITIRTALLKEGKAYVQAGGGIVADSSPDYEYNESCNKAKAMMKALAAAKMFDKSLQTFIIFVISILFCIFSFSGSSAYALSNSSKKNSLASIEKKISLKDVARQATYLAWTKLAVNPESRKGLILVKFAHYLYPKFKPLLLLRAKLKYKLPINIPKRTVSEADFVKSLKEIVKGLTGKTALSKHLTAIIDAMIIQFHPDDENALIQLMEFSDSGMDVRIDKLLERKLSDFMNIAYDPNDSRYVISNIKRTILVPANVPWTDTWVKVKAGKIVRVTARGQWGFGDGPFPTTDANGFEELSQEDKPITVGKRKKVIRGRMIAIKGTSLRKRSWKKSELIANPGALLAKIGSKVYPVGRSAVFKCETTGILYFGPFEWGNYSDNTGSLMVSFEVSDK